MSVDAPKEIYRKLGKRDLYLWGAGNLGRGLCRKLKDEGFTVAAFIDSNRDQLPSARVMGLPVLSPRQIADLSREENGPAIVVTPFFHQNEIIKEAEAAGFVSGENLFGLDQLTPYIYVVDVSGACNLRCLSCPRGPGRKPGPKAGFMAAEIFGRVVKKIRREDPLAASLQLYQWGEPLLNPELPEIIRLAQAEDFSVAVSSNLNPKADLAAVIGAKPAWFRASLSGFGEGYEVTHTGGRWPVIKENLEKLARLKNEFNPEMKVEIFYHLYRHNRGRELQDAKNFCRDLGFEFHPVWAYLISLDEILHWREGGDLPAPAREVADMLEIDLESALGLAWENRNEACLVENVIQINWDLSVANCMMFHYREDNQAVDDFLETSLADLQKRRRGAGLCGRCRRFALHRYCQVYNTWPTEGLS